MVTYHVVDVVGDGLMAARRGSRQRGRPSRVFSALFCWYFVLALTLTLGVLLTWLLPSLVVGGATLWACVCFITYMQLERFALIVTALAAGMVLTCLIGDWALIAAQLIWQAFRGVEMNVVRLALTCGAITVLGRIVGDEEAVGIVSILSCRGEKNHLGQVVDVNFSWSSAPSTRHATGVINRPVTCGGGTATS